MNKLWLSATFVFFCALLYRVTNIDTIEFKADEAMNLFLASRPLFGHSMPPATTASSVGILNPPLLNYLLFPLVLLSLSPYVISTMIGVINALAVTGFYLITAHYWGKKTGILASLFLAFSPWMILYSRKIWAQDFIVPLFLFIYWSTHKIIIEKDVKFWVVYAFFSMLLIQLHQTSIIYIILLTLSMFFKINWKYLLLGSILGLIPFLPYVHYQYSHACPDCKVITSLRSKLSPVRVASHFIRPMQIIGQGNFRYIFGPDLIKFKEQFPLAYGLRPIFYIEYILLPICLVLFFLKNPQWRFLAVTSAVFPFCLYVFNIEQPMHYHIISTLPSFLFLGYSLPKNRVTIALSLLLLVCTVFYTDSFFRFLRANNGTNGDYGLLFSNKPQTVQTPEIRLAGYVDTRFFRGDMPIPSMLYDYSQTYSNLPQLIKNYQTHPSDSRIYLELFAYFTRNRSGKKVIDTYALLYPELTPLAAHVSSVLSLQ